MIWIFLPLELIWIFFYLIQEDLIQRGTPSSISQLTITQSLIQEIEADVFTTTFTSINDLDLSNNNIKTLSPGAFNGLSHLRTLNLSGNKIDDLGSALQPLVSLQKLDLSYNSINDLNDKTFSSQSDLYWLRLDGNTLNRLTGPVFQPLQFLSELRARLCSIYVVSEDFLQSVQRLARLDLGDNVLNTFPVASPAVQMRNLQHLHLDGNSFTSLKVITYNTCNENLFYYELALYK